MRVVHVSARESHGGAARAANRIHRGLLDLGLDSTMFVAERASDDPTVIPYLPEMGWRERLARRWRLRRLVHDRISEGFGHDPVRSEQFSDDRTVWGHDMIDQLPAADVLHLHWVAGFVDYRRFFNSGRVSVPIVWTPQDLNPFTGGCHYDGGCDRFTDSCGACPQLGSNDPDDLSRQVWARKNAALSGTSRLNLHIAAGSDWLLHQASRSSLFRGLPMSKVPYALDTEVFAPQPKQAAKARLGLNTEATVILFVADSLELDRKGYRHLLEALEGLRHRPDLFLLSIGRGRPAGDRIPGTHLGSIADDRLLAQVYSAADLFVIPSLEEAFGQTALEAMACGTPAVGFDVGGIPDIVVPGRTGRLARAGDVESLRETIVGLLDDPEELRLLARESRRHVLETHTLAHQAKEYLALYQAILSKGTDGGPQPAPR